MLADQSNILRTLCCIVTCVVNLFVVVNHKLNSIQMDPSETGCHNTNWNHLLRRRYSPQAVNTPTELPRVPLSCLKLTQGEKEIGNCAELSKYALSYQTSWNRSSFFNVLDATITVYYLLRVTCRIIELRTALTSIIMSSYVKQKCPQYHRAQNLVTVIWPTNKKNSFLLVYEAA